MIKKDTYVDVNLKEFKFDSNIAKDILKVGIPSSLDMLMMPLAITVLLVIFAPQLALIFAYTPDTAPLIPEITNFLRIASFGLLL